MILFRCDWVNFDDYTITSNLVDDDNNGYCDGNY